MLFNSYIFMFVFLPLTLAGYFLINRFKKYTLANCFLIGMSLWFYGYFNYSYLLIICLSILVNFTLSRLIRSDGRSAAVKKALFIFGLLINTGSIFYFKYYDFFLDNLNRLFRTDFPLKNLLLPLGISFFTFQQISFLVDSYRGEIKDYRFDEYALFVVFFPQLIAGPIVLHDEMIPQFSDRTKRVFNCDNASHGLFCFAIGLAKKVIIADTLSSVVATGYSSLSDISSAEAWLTSICYTMQLYFDFSGYSDMAIGLGKMFNIELPQNFDSPYRSTSIAEFSGTWHMTLTRFLKTYIYYPLGGSRKGEGRTYLNIMIVYMVSGLWHGANWTFILWGILFGIMNCLDRLLGKRRKELHAVTRWTLFFLSSTILMVIFRSASLGEALWILKKMFSMSGGSIRPEMMEGLFIDFYRLIGFIPGVGALLGSISRFPVWVTLAVLFFLVLNVKNCSRIRFKPSAGTAAITVILLGVSTLLLSGVTEFLYFNF